MVYTHKNGNIQVDTTHKNGNIQVVALGLPQKGHGTNQPSGLN